MKKLSLEEFVGGMPKPKQANAAAELGVTASAISQALDDVRSFSRSVVVLESDRGLFRAFSIRPFGTSEPEPDFTLIA